MLFIIFGAVRGNDKTLQSGEISTEQVKQPGLH